MNAALFIINILDVFDNDKWTPLHSACDGGHKEVAQYLVEKQRCNIGKFIVGLY